MARLRLQAVLPVCRQLDSLKPRSYSSIARAPGRAGATRARLRLQAVPLATRMRARDRDGAPAPAGAPASLPPAAAARRAATAAGASSLRPPPVPVGRPATRAARGSGRAAGARAFVHARVWVLGVCMSAGAARAKACGCWVFVLQKGSGSYGLIEACKCAFPRCCQQPIASPRSRALNRPRGTLVPALCRPAHASSEGAARARPTWRLSCCTSALPMRPGPIRPTQRRGISDCVG